MSKYPTPDLSHFTASEYEHVYEPAEDTFLMLDALEADSEELLKLKPTICLEIGSGSGCISSFLSTILCNTTFHLCTDISMKACLATKSTIFKNKNQFIDPICTDLVSGLEKRLHGVVDVLLFNPPYVVTPSCEIDKSDVLSLTWAGGKDGREVIDKVLPLVPLLLSPSGVLYMIIIRENKPDEIKSIMSTYGFSMEIVLTRKTGPENLYVLKFKKNKS